MTNFEYYSMNKMGKNRYGQYFTPALIVDFMIDLATCPKDTAVLEPSAGEGIFLRRLAEKNFTDCEGIEIDDSLINTSPFPIYYESFVSKTFNRKYGLIIGNPPYIRWKNLEEDLKRELEGNLLWKSNFNSLCDYLFIFILKSIELLEDGGELIFVTPEYWMNTTHSISLRNYMVENGFFECIFHFNETPIFNKVTASILIFKYIKSKEKVTDKIQLVKYYSKKAIKEDDITRLKLKLEIENGEYFEISQFKRDHRWILADDSISEEIDVYEKSCLVKNEAVNDLFGSLTYKMPTLGQIADIGNGMVSGLDKAFQINARELNALEEKNTIQVLKAKNLAPFHYKALTKYIFINEEVASEEAFQNKYPQFHQHLLPYKESLNERYSYNRIINYWEWVFLRNYKLFSKNCKKIFVPCKERISSKDYFRFTLVEPGIYPTQDVTGIVLKDGVKEDVRYILALLNSKYVFDWMRYKGIVKGSIVEFSEKPLSSLPIRLINWNDEEEIALHNQIVEEAQHVINGKPGREVLAQLIDALFCGKLELSASQL